MCMSGRHGIANQSHLKLLFCFSIKNTQYIISVHNLQCITIFIKINVLSHSCCEYLDSLATRGYFDNLKRLAEEMYNENNGTPVALIVHSMGGPMSLYFLNEVVTQEWKDKYIKVYIPLSGAFAAWC